MGGYCSEGELYGVMMRRRISHCSVSGHSVGCSVYITLDVNIERVESPTLGRIAFVGAGA